MAAGLFDAHLQADGLTRADLGLLASFGVRAALLPSHDGIPDASAEDLLAHFRDLTQLHPRRLLEAGIRPYVALGIPPGRAPERDLEQVLALLPHFCSQARVVALGTMGLGVGAPRDEHVLQRQLQLAAELGLPALVELPRLSEGLVRRTLAILRESKLAPERVLITRARPEQLAAILGCGHLARVGLRGGKARLERLVAHVRQRGPAGIILGSEAGDGATDLLAVAHVALALQKAGLSERVIRKVTGENALELLRIDRESLALTPAARNGSS